MWYKLKKIYQRSNLVRPRRLPSAYQEVEWIQSSWNQYINTWVTAPTNYLMTYMKINPQTVSTWSQDFRAGWAYNWSRANVHYIGYWQWKFVAGLWWWDYSTWISISANTLYEITMTANNGSWSVNINGSTASWTYSWTVALNQPFFLFRNNESWSAWAGWTFKIYSFQMTTSNWLVRDFVPCYRKSDSVIWMYDLVNKQFYTNSWSWTFTKWQDVN